MGNVERACSKQPAETRHRGEHPTDSELRAPSVPGLAVRLIFGLSSLGLTTTVQAAEPEQVPPEHQSPPTEPQLFSPDLNQFAQRYLDRVRHEAKERADMHRAERRLGQVNEAAKDDKSRAGARDNIRSIDEHSQKLQTGLGEALDRLEATLSRLMGRQEANSGEASAEARVRAKQQHTEARGKVERDIAAAMQDAATHDVPPQEQGVLGRSAPPPSTRPVNAELAHKATSPAAGPISKGGLATRRHSGISSLAETTNEKSEHSEEDSARAKSADIAELRRRDDTRVQVEGQRDGQSGPLVGLEHAKRGVEPVIQVLGVGASGRRTYEGAQALASESKRPVIPIMNQTAAERLSAYFEDRYGGQARLLSRGNAGAEALGRKAGRVVGDLLGRGVDAARTAFDRTAAEDLACEDATRTLAAEVMERLRAGKRVDIVCHSQGTVITQNGLKVVERRLAEMEAARRITEKERIAQLRRIKVVATGAFAYAAKWPQYVTVHPLNDPTDPISSLGGYHTLNPLKEDFSFGTHDYVESYVKKATVFLTAPE